jgi:hypothetical protein
MATALIASRPPVWADELAPMYHVSGGVGLGFIGRVDVRTVPSSGVKPNTVSTPSAMSVSADLLGEHRVEGGLWLDLALRMGMLTETPSQAIVGNVFVDGNFAGAEVGIAYRASVMALRLTVGPTYFDLHWSDIGGDSDYKDAVTSWGVTARPELALELGPARGWSFLLAVGAAGTLLVQADDPVGEIYLALGLGSDF